MNTAVTIRRAIPEKDARVLAEIYAPYVDQTAITFEYTAPSAEEFASRMTHTLKRYPYLVAEIDGTAAGYAYVSEFKSRAAYDWSVETSIYVRMGMEHMGIGKKLYEACERVLAAMNILNLNACIAAPQQEDETLTDNSIDFHAHLGYALVGRFHDSGYKFGRWYDMVWMEKMIGPHPQNPKAVIPFPELKDADRLIQG